MKAPLTCQATLPASFYYEPEQYELELKAIWYRDWICLGRESEWPETGDYRLCEIGGERILVTRSEDGALQAFFNTCRHRGSTLCEAEAGRFKNNRIVCPYHAWVYSLQGDLERTPWRMESDDFKPAEFSLYRVALQPWRGFVFVNLAENPGQTLAQAVSVDGSLVENWPLEKLGIAHRESHLLACNWKIFWENYLECYHCPGVHPELCKLVPQYRSGSMREGMSESGSRADSSVSELAGDAVTWSADGRTSLPWFKELTEQERSVGMTFANFLPTMFMVAHVDYVRTVRVFPRGPEQTELIVDWLVHPEAMEHPDFDAKRLAEFGSLVVRQDARVCELNQRGLHCQRHKHGLLVPQESGVHEFEQWVLQKLQSQPPSGTD